MSERYLIVGLGNPGAQYANTRHNIGWQALDELAARHGMTFSRHEHKAQLADGSVRGKRVLLVKPQTYMNASGQSVQPLASFYKVPAEHILVINDDMDIPLGTLRLRASGSAGGQRGLGNILQCLGTQQIARVRVGVGRPPGKMDPAAYVLQRFSGDDAILAAQAATRAAQAAETWLTDGIEEAMNRYNGAVDAPRPVKRERVLIPE